MNRFLAFAPAAALALLSIVSPVSAQEAEPDPTQQFFDLRRDNVQFDNAWRRFQRQVWEKCDLPSDEERLALADQANSLVARSLDIAPRIGGRYHVNTLDIQQHADARYWYLTHFEMPEICYQPPA